MKPGARHFAQHLSEAATATSRFQLRIRPVPSGRTIGGASGMHEPFLYPGCNNCCVVVLNFSPTALPGPTR
jgi:hypothetical protein